MTKIKTDKSGTEKLFVLFDDGDKLWADSDDRVQKLEMKHNQTKSQTRKRRERVLMFRKLLQAAGRI